MLVLTERNDFCDESRSVPHLKLQEESADIVTHCKAA